MSLAEDAARHEASELRATQTLVSHMSFCWRHPSVVAIEIAWRWLFGVPFLLILAAQAQVVLTQIPPASTGLARLNAQNPWVSSVLLSDAVGVYQPAVIQALRWLLPVAFVAWAVLSGLGRTLVLWRMEVLNPTRLSSRPLFLRKAAGVVGLQALWLLALLNCFWLWYRGVSWASATHITAAAEPNLVGYLCWLIFISLGLFTLWAVVSWTLAVAPVLYLLEPDINPAAAVVRSFRLGKAFSGKLVEVNLVMAIVKIALIVLAMVFSAAPLPFSDQFGQDFMHLLYVVIAIAFFIANDYFHVVRLRSFVAFWRHYRGQDAVTSVVFASDRKIRRYATLQDKFAVQILGIEELWFVSDESSLWDFTHETTLEPYYAKILEVYGVDVSDIEGALLWKIFQRIADR